MSCSVFTILDDVFGPSLVPSAALQVLGSPSLLCILGSHMFFNLKEAAEHNVNVGTNWSSYEHSAIRFGDDAGDVGEEVEVGEGVRGGDDDADAGSGERCVCALTFVSGDL